MGTINFDYYSPSTERWKSRDYLSSAKSLCTNKTSRKFDTLTAGALRSMDTLAFGTEAKPQTSRNDISSSTIVNELSEYKKQTKKFLDKLAKVVIDLSPKG